MVGLPCIVGIEKAVGIKTRDSLIGIGGTIGVQVLIVADVIVARDAVASTQLAETPNTATALQPAFFRKYPSRTDGAEVGISPPVTETRGAVASCRQIQKVSPGMIIIYTAKKRLVAIFVIRCAIDQCCRSGD